MEGTPRVGDFSNREESVEDLPLDLPDAVGVSCPVVVDSLGVQAAVPLEVPDGQLEDVRLLQLGVFGVVSFGRVQDESLESGEALVDPRPAPLLHQGLVGSPRLRVPLRFRSHHCWRISRSVSARFRR